MRKINLKAKNIDSNAVASKRASGRISLVVSFGILILAGGLYGGVAYLKNVQAEKIIAIKSEIQTLKKQLDTNKDFKNVYDFQDRLIQLDEINKNKIKQIDVLNQLAQSTLGANVMKNLKINIDDGKSTINATLSTPNLITVAKQINSYKTISSQNQVFLKSSGIKDDAMEMNVSFILDFFGK